VILYESIDQVPDIIRGIERMDPVERQATIDETVQNIRGSHVWQETARSLVTLASEAT